MKYRYIIEFISMRESLITRINEIGQEGYFLKEPRWDNELEGWHLWGYKKIKETYEK